MPTATVPTIDLTAFDRVAPIESRVRLMISYLQLLKHQVVDQPLPRATYVGLLRDAKPDQRVSLTLKLLDLQQANPRLRIEIPTELLVLAVYETTDEAQLAELTRKLPWTEAVRTAIDDISCSELEPGRRRTIPIELRVTQRLFGDTQASTPAPRLDVDAMLRIGKSPQVLAALGNYRRLRVAGVFRGGISSARVARILESIRDGSDRIAATDWAHRAGLLTATHFGRTVVHALADIDDDEQLLRTQAWYLQMLRLGAVHEPVPARLVARSIAWAFSVEAFADVHGLLALLPDALIDDLSIQAALETDPRGSVRTGKTAPHAAVPGALWQSVREVA